MRAWLLACAALALARAAAPTPRLPPPPPPSRPLDPQRLDHIKSQILAKLGLSSRPTPLGAPPRDVVRQILARAADPQSPPHHHDDSAMREIIAIAHRGLQSNLPILTIVFFITTAVGIHHLKKEPSVRWSHSLAGDSPKHVSESSG